MDDVLILPDDPSRVVRAVSSPVLRLDQRAERAPVPAGWTHLLAVEWRGLFGRWRSRDVTWPELDLASRTVRLPWRARGRPIRLRGYAPPRGTMPP